MKINFTLNGQRRSLDTEPDRRLLDVLREDFKLTSVREGCSQGECGACTVLLDKKAVTSCLILISQVEGREIITVEGLEESGELQRFMTAFRKNGAVQCGYCTPGMIMSARALFYRTAKPDRSQIKEAIAGNLCRCTGYNNIIDAIAEIAEMGGL